LINSFDAVEAINKVGKHFIENPENEIMMPQVVEYP
jgi:hypothetical protein